MRRVGRFIFAGVEREKETGDPRIWGWGMSAKDDVRGRRRNVGVCGESRLKQRLARSKSLLCPFTSGVQERHIAPKDSP